MIEPLGAAINDTAALFDRHDVNGVFEWPIKQLNG
jgi:hypothetical protein